MVLVGYAKHIQRSTTLLICMHSSGTLYGLSCHFAVNWVVSRWTLYTCLSLIWNINWSGAYVMCCHRKWTSFATLKNPGQSLKLLHKAEILLHTTGLRLVSRKDRQGCWAWTKMIFDRTELSEKWDKGHSHKTHIHKSKRERSISAVKVQTHVQVAPGKVGTLDTQGT